MRDERRKEMRAHRDMLEAYEYKIKLLESQLKMVRWDLQRLVAALWFGATVDRRKEHEVIEANGDLVALGADDGDGDAARN